MIRHSLIALLILAPMAVGGERSSVSSDGPSSLRVAIYANTMLPVGEWAQLPDDPAKSLFGPSLGGEAEVMIVLGQTLWGVVGKYGAYDPGDYVGLGEGTNRVEAAAARSISVFGIAGYRLSDQGGIRTWGYLELGMEWLRVTETVDGREYGYDKIFQPSLCAGLTFCADVYLTENLILPVKASYDVSFGQVLGYGNYSGQGADLVLAVGLGFYF